MRIWVQRYRLPLILLWQNRPFCPGISMKLGKFMIIYTIRKIRQAHPSFHQSYCWFCISYLKSRISYLKFWLSYLKFRLSYFPLRSSPGHPDSCGSKVLTL